MELSREREAELIEQNMPKICQAVDCFMAKSHWNSPIVSYEDLQQTVTEAFLLYMRKCESEEALDKFPWYDATHAMCVAVAEAQPFSIPKSTRLFNQVIHSLPQTVSFDLMVTAGLEIDGMSHTWVQDKETEIDFNSFMAGQDGLNNRIVALRLHDTPIRKIASHCAVSKTKIWRRIDKIYDDFKKFNEEDQNS